MHAAPHIAGREVVNHGFGRHAAILSAQTRRALRGTEFTHALDQPTHILRHQLGAQGPGRIDVADGVDEIRHVGKHHALVRIGLGKHHRLAIDAITRAAQHFQIETGGGDDDVGRKHRAGFQLDAGGREARDLIGDDLGLARAQRLEQISIGHQTQALLPRVIARREMLLHIEVGTELLAHHPD